MQHDEDDPPITTPGVSPAGPTGADDPASPPSTRKFCRDCGAPWQTGWLLCGHCAARADAAAYVRDVPITDTSRPIGSAMGLYFAWLAISVVSVIWALADGDELTIDITMTIAASVLVLAWCVPAWRELVPALRRWPRAIWFVGAGAGAVVTFVIASLAVWALQRWTGIEEIRYTDEYFAAGLGWAAVLSVCVQPAVFEELAFRGVIFSSLRRVLDPRETVLVTALMFMILHLSVPSFPHLFAIGLLLGWMRNVTGSMYPGMLMHFAHNGLVVLTERYPELTPWW